MSLGVWKHIGLHGHSVGTFACEAGGIQWTSALTHGSVQAITKSIPKEAIKSVQWTVFGKSGYIRVQTNGDKKLHHEIRFDGFPVNEFDQLRTVLKDNYDMELTKLTMSSAGAQYGISKMSGKKLTFRHCILEDAEEEGEVRLLDFPSPLCVTFISSLFFLVGIRSSCGRRTDVPGSCRGLAVCLAWKQS